MVDPAPAARRLIRVVIAVSASLSLVLGVVGAASAVRWVQLRDVGVDPGALRLSLAGLQPEQIRSGLAILGRIFSGEAEAAAQNFEPASAMV